MITTWNASFESEPLNSDIIGNGNESIMEVKTAIRERVASEHEMSVTGTQSRHGVHASGSAVTWFQASAPTTLPGGATIGALDAGRIWINSSDGVVKIWTGVTWLEVDPAANILAKLLTVDGSGSGLDADVVRGTTPTATGLLALAAAANTTVTGFKAALAGDADTVSGYGIGVTLVDFTGNIDSGITKGGFYAIMSGATGTFPTIAGVGYTILAVIEHSVISTGVSYQTYRAYNTTRDQSVMAIRAKAGGSWGTWQAIWTSYSDGNGGQPPAPKPKVSTGTPANDTQGTWSLCTRYVGGASTGVGGTWAFLQFSSAGMPEGAYIVAGSTDQGTGKILLCWRVT